MERGGLRCGGRWCGRVLVLVSCRGVVGINYIFIWKSAVVLDKRGIVGGVRRDKGRIGVVEELFL